MSSSEKPSSKGQAWLDKNLLLFKLYAMSIIIHQQLLFLTSQINNHNSNMQVLYNWITK